MDSEHRLVVRVANRSLSFLKPVKGGVPEYIPYVVKSGVSVAANLRTAFKEDDSLTDGDGRVLLSVCSPVSLVPLDDFMEDTFDADVAYNYVFPGYQHDEKICNVLPELNAVAIFSVNKDLKLVVDDRFRNVRIQNVMQPVWSHLFQRSQLVMQRRKLYAYFHDGLMDVFSFHHRRFRYSNAFLVTDVDDVVYYLLVAWKQIGMDNLDDELHIVGNYSEPDNLIEKLRKFLRKVYLVNPSASLNRAPVASIANINFDMMLCV